MATLKKKTSKPKLAPTSGRDENGLFVKGNKWWQVRSSAGLNPTFETAEKLRDCCLEYFEWLEQNPLIEGKVFSYQGEVVNAELPKMRAATIVGLCLHLGISDVTWRSWRNPNDPKHRPDLVAVIATVEAMLREQKFVGAAADLLNANIIARDIGLVDRTDTTTNGESLNAEINDMELAMRLAFMLTKGAAAHTGD